MKVSHTLLCLVLLLFGPTFLTGQEDQPEPEGQELPTLPTSPYVKEDAEALQAHIDDTQAKLTAARQALSDAEQAAAEEGLSEEDQATRDEAATSARGEVETLASLLAELRQALTSAEQGPTRKQLEVRRKYDETYALVVQIRKDLQVRAADGEGADAITEGEIAKRIRDAEEEQNRIETLAKSMDDFEAGKGRIYERLSDLEKLEYERRWASQRLQLSIDAYDHLNNEVFGAYRAYEKRAFRGLQAIRELRELWAQIQGTPAARLEIPEPARNISELNLAPTGSRPEVETWYRQRGPSRFAGTRSRELNITHWENRLRQIQQQIDLREDFMERLEGDVERLKNIMAQAEASAIGDAEAEPSGANGQLEEYQKLSRKIDRYDQDVIDHRNEIEKLNEERVGLVEIQRGKQEVEKQIEEQVRQTEALIAAINWHYLADDQKPEDADTPRVSEEIQKEIEASFARPEIRLYILDERLKAEKERLSSAKRDTRQATTQIEILDRRVERLNERNEEIENALLPMAREQYYEEVGKTVGIRAGKVVIVIVAAWLLLFLIRKVGEPLVERVISRSGKRKKSFSADEEQRARTIMTVFMTTAKVVVYLTAIMFAIAQFDVDYGPLLVAAGGVSLAVGFGAQTLVRDFFAGFFILLEGQYSIGDVVEVGGRIGTVEHIGLRTTVLRSLNGDVHTIPNGEIVSTTNMTKLWSRAVVDVGIAYEENVDQVGEVVQAVAKELREDPVWGEKVLDAIYMGVQSLGDSSVVLRILLKTRAGEQWGASREFNRRCKLKFDELGIEIPWPQRVVSHKEHVGMSEEDIQKMARAKRAKLLRYTRKLRGEEAPEDAELAAMSVEERDRAETLAKHEADIAKAESKESGEEVKKPNEVAPEHNEEAEDEEEQLSAAEKWAKQKATETLTKEELEKRRKQADKEVEDPGNDPAGGDDEEKS